MIDARHGPVDDSGEQPSGGLGRSLRRRLSWPIDCLNWLTRITPVWVVLVVSITLIAWIASTKPFLLTGVVPFGFALVAAAYERFRRCRDR